MGHQECCVNQNRPKISLRTVDFKASKVRSVKSCKVKSQRVSPKNRPYLLGKDESSQNRVGQNGSAKARSRHTHFLAPYHNNLILNQSFNLSFIPLKFSSTVLACENARMTKRLNAGVLPPFVPCQNL